MNTRRVEAPTRPHRFGWCMTGHHGKCPAEIGGPDGLHCGCACHEEES